MSSSLAPPSDPQQAAEPPTLLVEPRDGTPAVVTTGAGLAAAVAALGSGTGPVAIDAERASGYRYSQRAYLVQLRRAGAGTVLIDPIACPDLTGLCASIVDAEWAVHAASQDLPCLAEVGLRPRRLFDTELAARLAGFERVGLGAIVERLLGIRLEKGHSAADWSTRPLPESWLRYAALDVELLVDLRDVLAADLVRQGKLAWAEEEFTAILTAPPPAPRADPWRRTGGLHKVRDRRQLAAVRALWEARDALARQRDIAPGRVLPDSAIVGAALVGPVDEPSLTALPVYGGPRMRRTAKTWLAALRAAAALPDGALPEPAPPVSGPPASTSRWAERDPAASGRLTRLRSTLAGLSERHHIPVENLAEPPLIRRIAWEPPDPAGPGALAAALVAGGARRWQVDLLSEPLAAALVAPPATGLKSGPLSERLSDLESGLESGLASDTSGQLAVQDGAIGEVVGLQVQVATPAPDRRRRRTRRSSGRTADARIDPAVEARGGEEPLPAAALLAGGHAQP